MDFEVMRACDGGRVVEKQLRNASVTRGRIIIKQEPDMLRCRAVLIARLIPAGGHRGIPALHDVALIACNGDTWTLAGFERIEAGPTRFECSVGQTWLLTPAVNADLAAAETKWGEAAGQADELRRQLVALRAEYSVRQEPK